MTRRLLQRTFGLLLLLLVSATAFAQTQGTGVVLVLPFENRSGQSSLDWVGESFAQTLNQRFNSAGFLTISRDDRAYALDHLGLPDGFRPSRATSIRIAQTLDAQFVIVGSFTTGGGRISAQAQVLDVTALHMTNPLDDSSELPRLLDLENSIAWKCARIMDPDFPVALSTFLAASKGIQLEAYEDYIRGIINPNPNERLKRLQASVQISPGNPAVLLALGKTQYELRQYDDAAKTLAQIPRNSGSALQANFYIGLSLFNSAHYAEAESAFAFVASRLPLPEVVNNQGVAVARQNKNAAALLQRAVNDDPQEADYHFNLAVTLHRHGDQANARKQAEQAVKLRPSDVEANELLSMLTPNSTTAPPAGFDPQERIRRTFSEANFRQAFFQMDQMRAMKMATLTPAERSAQLSQAGMDYLAQGLVPEAEREFQLAINADARNAAAHLGLAQVRERTGDTQGAQHEATVSLGLHPTAEGHLVLARLAVQANQLPLAAAEVANALQLDAKSGAALGMKQVLASRGQQLP